MTAVYLSSLRLRDTRWREMALARGALSIMADGLADLGRSPDTTTHSWGSALFRSSEATAVPEIDEDLRLGGVLEARSQDVFHLQAHAT